MEAPLEPDRSTHENRAQEPNHHYRVFFCHFNTVVEPEANLLQRRRLRIAMAFPWSQEFRSSTAYYSHIGPGI
jgi:hypothetical protein